MLEILVVCHVSQNGVTISGFLVATFKLHNGELVPCVRLYKQQLLQYNCSMFLLILSLLWLIQNNLEFIV